MAKKKWMGDLPPVCNICDESIPDEEYFIDGRIRGVTSWAIMCVNCHAKHGAGLGTGYGQLYDVKTKVKVEG